MSRKPLPGRLLPVVYALALHAVIAAVLVFRFEHAPTPITGGPQVEPVKAEVIDEQLIADELKRLREREEQQLEKERKRIEQLEKRQSRHAFGGSRRNAGSPSLRKISANASCAKPGASPKSRENAKRRRSSSPRPRRSSARRPRKNAGARNRRSSPRRRGYAPRPSCARPRPRPNSARPETRPKNARPRKSNAAKKPISPARRRSPERSASLSRNASRCSMPNARNILPRSETRLSATGYVRQTPPASSHVWCAYRKSPEGRSCGRRSPPAAAAWYSIARWKRRCCAPHRFLHPRIHYCLIATS